MAPEYWPVEYASDAYIILKEKESKMPRFQFRSPQITARPNSIKWIFSLAEFFQLNDSTVHLAVHILDRFMDCHSIPEDKINIIVLICLQLSAKFEELEDNVPLIRELNFLVKNQYQRRDFVHFQSMVLDFLDWNFSLPIATKFLEYFSLLAFSQSDWNSLNFATYEEFWRVLQHSIKDYLDLSLEEVNVLMYPQSVVAGACVVLARRKLGLEPLWPASLEKLTHYSLSDLAACARLLLRSNVNRGVSRKRKLPQSPDQGYVTGGSSNSSPETPCSKRANTAH